MLSLLDLLYPPKCIFCGCDVGKDTYLCEKCRKDAPFFKNSKTKLQFLDSYTAVWYYKGYVRESLLCYKFHYGLYLIEPYSRFLAARIRQQYPDGLDLLTWVPTSPLRSLRRGYDQCHLLAQAVGRELGVRPVRLLKKIRHNPAQSGLAGAAARRANVVGAYTVLKKDRIQGKRILLLDDILTTGATAGECARMLKTAGVAEVHCAVVAATSKD